MNINFFDAKVLNNINLCIFATDKKHKHSLGIADAD